MKLVEIIMTVVEDMGQVEVTLTGKEWQLHSVS